MQLPFLLALVIAFVLAENSPHEATSNVPAHAAAVVGLLVLSCGTILFSARLVMRKVRAISVAERGSQASANALNQWLQRRKNMNHAAWFAGLVGTISCARLPQLVRWNLGLNDTVLVDDLLILLPVLLPAFVIWSTDYDVERTVRQWEGNHELPSVAGGRMRFLGQQARFYCGLMLLPLLVVIGGHDLVQQLGTERSAASLGAWAWLPLLAAMMVALPNLLRKLWHTQPLVAGPLREQLSRVLGDAQLPIRDILVWYTDRLSFNAVVLGVVPWNRFILLTDALLAHLSTDELLVVFRHEVAHVHRRHFVQRLLVLGLPIAAWLAVQGTGSESGEFPFAAAGVSALNTSLVSTAALVAYFTLTLGWLSRQQEHDADLWACRLDGVTNDATDESAIATSRSYVNSFAQALAKLVGDDHTTRSRQTWLHPSVDQRLLILRTALECPDYAARVSQPLRWATRTIWFAYLCLGVVSASRLLAEHPAI